MGNIEIVWLHPAHEVVEYLLLEQRGGQMRKRLNESEDAANALVKHFRVDLLFPIETTEANLSPNPYWLVR
jgi:hypothetical protein